MVLLVFGVLVRPAGLGLAVVVPAVGVWVNSGGAGSYIWRRTLLRAVVAGVVLAVALGLWAERTGGSSASGSG